MALLSDIPYFCTQVKKKIEPIDRMLRQLELVDMDAAALVLRTTFDQALPSLAGLHTAGAYREVV
jgi:hypothetical protein